MQRGRSLTWGVAAQVWQVSAGVQQGCTSSCLAAMSSHATLASCRLLRGKPCNSITQLSAISWIQYHRLMAQAFAV